MPHRFWRLPIPPEVNAFQAEVGGHQSIGPGAHTQHGTVIPDPREDLCLSSMNTSVRQPQPGFRYAANLADQRFFGERHDNTLYRNGRTECGLQAWT